MALGKNIKDRQASLQGQDQEEILMEDLPQDENTNRAIKEYRDGVDLTPERAEKRTAEIARLSQLPRERLENMIILERINKSLNREFRDQNVERWLEQNPDMKKLAEQNAARDMKARHIKEPTEKQKHDYLMGAGRKLRQSFNLGLGQTPARTAGVSVA